MKRYWIIAIPLLLSLPAVPPAVVWAQQPEADDEDAAASKRELVTPAKHLRDRLEDFIQQMSAVAETLEKTDPQGARVLKQAVEHAQRSLVTDKMDVVIRSLLQGLDEVAERNQSQVVEDLRELLLIIQGGMADKSDLQKRIEKLREYREQLANLADDQRKLERETRPAANAKELDEQTRKLIENLESIIREQSELREKTDELAEAPEAVARLSEMREALRRKIDQQQALNEATQRSAMAKLPVLGEAQKTVGRQTEELQKQFDEAARDASLSEALKQADADAQTLEQAAEKLSSARREMDRSADALGKSVKPQAAVPQAQALTDLKDAEQALSDALKKLSAQTPAGNLAASQDELAEKTSGLEEDIAALAEKAGIDPEQLEGSTPEDAGDETSGDTESPDSKGASPKSPGANLKKAAGHMSRAADQLDAQKKTTAAEQQDKALDELGKQLAKAKALRKEALAKGGKSGDAQKQQNIAKDAGKLAEHMEKGDNGDAAPGTKSVKSGSKNAAGAAGKMKKQQLAQANQDQKQAAEEFVKAINDLDQEIQRLEELEKIEKLTRIEEKLDEILTRQKVITKQTRETYDPSAQEDGTYDRQALQQLTEQSQGEGQLAEEISIVRGMLVDEDKTVVFPAVLEDVREDLKQVQVSLSDRDAGPLTQATQEQIEATLEQLIASVREELSKGPGRGRSGGQPGQGPPPPSSLIPALAELRMLRLQQQQVYSGTQRVDRMLRQEQISKAEADAEAGKLAQRQKKVHRLAEEVRQKVMNRRKGQ